jgi:NH3-dependent NAD+ synthetase
MEWSTEFEETQRKQKEEKEMIEKFLSMDRHLYLFNRRIDHDERQRQEKRLAEINKERRKIHQQMQMILGVMNGERTPPKKSNGKENENRYPKSKINNQ